MNVVCGMELADARIEATPSPGSTSEHHGSAQTEEGTASQTLQGLLTPGLRSIHRAPSHPYELTLAEVRGLDDAGGMVVTLQSGQRVSVQVAVGCLIQPERGDFVQVFANHQGGWITMVLRRADAASGVTLAAGGRDIQVQAPNLSLVATERLSLEASRLEQRAALLETAAQERASTVLGSDTLQAGAASWNIESHLGMHSRTQLMTADSLLKINGGQIHMA
jgi:hypothetical protein